MQQIIQSKNSSEDSHSESNWRKAAQLFQMQQIIQPSCSSERTPAHSQCTMRTLESRNSSGLIAPGHIPKNHQRYSKERHFFFKLSTRRKIEKIQFPWVSYSKFSILAKYASVSYTQICIWYRAILLEDASDASVPLYKYGSFLHTAPPYFLMYALCSGSAS